MKYVVCVPDGCADEPIDELGGRTPLEAAHLPNLQALAARGAVGRAATIPEGLPPGSDVGNMSIFGYDPAEFHTGRAPIEAAAMRLDFEGDRIAYRCNLVTVGTDGTMVDFAGGHPDTDAASEAIAALDHALGGEVSFHPGVQYRHIMLAPPSWLEADCVPPHDLTGQPAVPPSGPAARRLVDLMDRSRPVVSRCNGVEANQIWLWGQGRVPRLPAFRDRFGVSGGLVTEVDLVRGLGVLTGLEVVEVPGATGWFDTDYAAMGEAALAGLERGHDLFIVHVEATDEAGHAGSVEEKVRALEAWDRDILASLVDGLDAMGPWRLLLLPDHATPVRLRTHTRDSVPYLLVDSTEPGPGGTYSEPATAACPPVAAHTLMGRLVGVR
ncbi:MAG: 2,3-bisphosphoglycerate-independent phosphoglycerate mutase [Acidimicrobiia bacterium]|nr:2,3-bisphosphoglycerate-independent phosphoglycerate mutase [Acidimicrobiia bacterium]